MDTNHDGVISQFEFSQGILKYVNMPSKDLKKLFRHFDKQQLGLIQKNNFMIIIKNHQLKKPTVLIEQNFNLQFEILNKFNKWVNTNQLTPDDAFRCFDLDFNGFLTKQELLNGILKYLKYPQHFITRV